MQGWTRGPSHRPRSKRCPETDAQAPRPLPSQRASRRSRKRAACALSRQRRINAVSPRAAVHVGNSGPHGKQWIFMGFNGSIWSAADFRDFWLPQGGSVPELFSAPAAVDKSVTSESLVLEIGKLRDDRIKIVCRPAAELAGIEQVGIGD